MDALRNAAALLALCGALCGCIEDQFLWTLTSEEGSALRTAASVAAAPEGAEAGWSMVCQRNGLPDARVCTLRAGLAPGAALSLAVWPADGFAALYGRDADAARLTAADGSLLAPERCLPRPQGRFVCVVAGAAGARLLADLRGGRLPHVEAGGRGTALPEGYASAERAFARDSRAWLERNPMGYGSGGGGSGGSM
jgi:hypothetical protein